MFSWYDLRIVVFEVIEIKKVCNLKGMFPNAGVATDNDKWELWIWDAGISIDSGVFPS